MPASQLKRLKAAAHEQRVAKQKGGKPAARATGPQKPTSKQKPAPSRASAQERAHTLRAQQLLPEFRARQKVGGIIDRRIGEDDPTLAPEEKEARRYAAERQRTAKKRNVFNLEDAEDDEEVGQALLTHGGKPLGGNAPRSMVDMVDDFEASDSDDSDEDVTSRREKKRKRLEEQVEEMMAQREQEPDRKRSKKEVMEEVIAKSKLHKYERQKQKEDDEDIRDQLDQGLPDLLSLLRGKPSKPKIEDVKGAAPAAHPNGVHPDRMQLMDKKTREQAEKEYDQSLRQLVMDKRAQPTERTKTEEEKAKEDAERLRGLEERRQKRMRGEPTSSEEEAEEDEDDMDADPDAEHDPFAEDDTVDEAAEFGLDSQKQPLDVEDEDDFIIDEDLVASGSDLEAYLSSDDEEAQDEDQEDDDDDDREFLQDVLSEKRSEGAEKVAAKAGKPLAYTYACPQTHDELVQTFRDVQAEDISTVVQRIRALYHPQLAAENKPKMAKFSAALVEYLPTMAGAKLSTLVIESIIRHIHSLAKTHGEPVAQAFRAQLSAMNEQAAIQASDLIILTAIGSIYPTSDHFHQVVTPAITIMTRWLGVTTPATVADSLHGAVLVALAVKYQRLSKRIVPEALRFTSLALQQASTLQDAALVTRHLQNLSQAMDLWFDQPAFIEMVQPRVLGLVSSGSDLQKRHPKPCSTLKQKLSIMLSQAQLRRRALELHHHRPLPIKMSVPKFEENFDPAGHYDPDKERSEEARLRKEYKREKKGAIRELRRDAEFMAREKLREKKEKDRLYEEKQRRIIGEIQREDGRERNEYEREKRKRQGRF